MKEVMQSRGPRDDTHEHDKKNRVIKKTKDDNQE
jgi:hypothetical protein